MKSYCTPQELQAKHDKRVKVLSYLIPILISIGVSIVTTILLRGM
jgi:sensor domain CHASE-containing protein